MKQKSLANKVLFIILFTIIFASVLITFVGTSLIYNATKSGIENEVVSAASTFRNLFEKEYDGDLIWDGQICRYGEAVVTSEDFNAIVDYIYCSDDMEFTFFYGGIRLFTTIVNPEGSSAAGTYAPANIVSEVIENGKSSIYDDININGIKYMGCYIPIVSSDGSVSGMYFAGKPLAMAAANARQLITQFIIVVFVTLILSLILCIAITERMVRDLGDITQYIDKISKGDFSAVMKAKTLKRDDEIGDIGRNAEKLCLNLRGMIERDPLTGLLNRRSCLVNIHRLMENRMLYTVVMGDIDYFKRINDTYGHSCGDYILKDVSVILSEYARNNDAFVSRWGGEEFIMVFRSQSDEETLVIVSEMLEKIRGTSFTYENKQIRVTMTFGISQVRSGDNAESAVNRADDLLYKGKEAGRNRIVV